MSPNRNLFFFEGYAKGIRGEASKDASKKSAEWRKKAATPQKERVL